MMADIDPLITAFIQLQIAPDAIKNVESKIDELVKSLERLKSVKIDFALSEKSRQALSQVQTLATALQGLSTSGGNIFRGAAQAARALGAVQKSATGALSETDKAFQSQFTAAERSFAKRLAASEFLFGNRKTARPTQEDFFAGRDAENAKKRVAQDDAFLANVLKNATDEANLSRQRFLTSLKRETKAVQQEARNLAEISFIGGERDSPEVTKRDVEQARENVSLLERQKKLAQEAAELTSRRTKEEEKLRATLKQQADENAKLNRERFQALFKTESKAVRDEAQRLARVGFGLGLRDNDTVTPEDLANAKLSVLQAQKKAEFAEQQKRIAKEQEEIAARQVAIEKASLELVKQSVSAETLRLARKKALFDFSRGKRADAGITREDILLSGNLIAKRNRDAEATQKQADAEAKLQARTDARIKAQLAGQDAAFRKQAQAFARASFISGRRENELITQRDIDNTIELRLLEDQIAISAKKAADQAKEKARAAQLNLDIARAAASLDVRRTAQRNVDELVLAGERQNRDVGLEDLAVAEQQVQLAKEKADEAERQAKAAKDAADAAEREAAARMASIRRGYTAKERRFAQAEVDREYVARRREDNVVNELDLANARTMLRLEQAITDAIAEEEEERKKAADAAEEYATGMERHWAKLKQQNLDRVYRDQQKAARDATAQVERLAAANRRARENLTQKLGGAFTATTQDLGFLFPQGQFVGNILRIGQAWGKVGGALGDVLKTSLGLSGAVGGLVKGFLQVGAAGVGVISGSLAKALSVFLNIAVKIGSTLAGIAITPLVGAFKLLLAPTLAVVRAFRTLIAYGPQLAVALGIGLAQTLTNSAIQIERLRNLFDQAFLGQGGAQFEALRKRADAMGISFEQAAEPMARLAFAAKSAGLEARATDNLFQGISNAAVALKLDSDRLGRAFTAFEQILSKGRVSSEELRGQLAEAIPGILPIVERALKKTGTELEDLLKKGKLTSNELIKALGPELQRAFQGGAAANANSLAAQVARIDNAFLRLKATLGAEIAPSFLRIKKALVDLAGSPQVLGFLRAVARRIADLFDLLRTSPAVQRFGELLAEAFRRLLPFVERIVSKILTLQAIANGTLLAGFIRLADYAIPKIDAALERVMKKVRELTGMSIFNVEDGLSFVNVLLEQSGQLKQVFDALGRYLFQVLVIGTEYVLYAGLNVIGAIAYAVKTQLTGLIWETLFATGKKGELRKVEDEIDSLEARAKTSRDFLAEPERQYSNEAQRKEGQLIRKAVRARLAEEEKAILEAKEKRKKIVADLIAQEREQIEKNFIDLGTNINAALRGRDLSVAGRARLKRAEDDLRKSFDPFLDAFETAKFENSLNGWVQAIKSAAEKAVDAVKPLTGFADNLGGAVNSSFGRFGNVIGNAVTGLLGPLGNLLGGRAQPFGKQAKVAANAFIDFGQQFIKESFKGGKPFAAFGPLLNSLAELSKTLPNVPGSGGRTGALQQETERIQSQFLDAESLFQSMQAQEQLKEQKKTNEELAMLRQEVKRGNDLAAARTPSGMMLDTRMRGAIA